MFDETEIDEALASFTDDQTDTYVGPDVMDMPGYVDGWGRWIAVDPDSTEGIFAEISLALGLVYP